MRLSSQTRRLLQQHSWFNDDTAVQPPQERDCFPPIRVPSLIASSLAIKPEGQKLNVTERSVTLMSSSKVWFITGVSSGFGLDLALYVLRAGHTVYGTVRNREKSSDAVSKIETAGGKCVVLDVTALESIPTVIQGVLEKVGRIDVLVNNNAGWAVMGALEDMK